MEAASRGSEEIPMKYVHLAALAGCLATALAAIGEQVLGVQGHPEFTPQIMQDIFKRHVALQGSELYETAVSSVENGRPDNQRFAQWIVNFLQA